MVIVMALERSVFFGLWAGLWKFTCARTEQKAHILTVVTLSAFMRMVTLYAPYRWYQQYLGQHHVKEFVCVLATEQQILQTLKYAKFISRICIKMPWEAKCLVQAMILVVYCRYYGLPYVLLTGMSKAHGRIDEKTNRDDHIDEHDKRWLAHAWVKVDRYTVMGDFGRFNSFKVLSTYCRY